MGQDISGNSPEAAEERRLAEIAEYKSRQEILETEKEQLYERTQAVVEKIGADEVDEINKTKAAFFHDYIAERSKRGAAGERIEEYEIDLSELTLDFIKGERHEEQFKEDWEKFEKWLQEKGHDPEALGEDAQELFRVDLLRRSFYRYQCDLHDRIIRLEKPHKDMKHLEELVKELGDELPYELIVHEAFGVPIEELSEEALIFVETIRKRHPEILSLEDFENSFIEEEENEE